MFLEGLSVIRVFFALVTRLLKHWSFTVFILSVVSFAHAEESEDITVALENVDIRELVRWASDFTDKSIILHPGVKGKVTVLAGEPVNEKDAYRVFLSILQVHGLSVIETEESLKIIPENEVNQSNTSISEVGQAFEPEESIIQLVKLKNVAANQLVSLLKPLMSKTAFIAAYPDTNLLILADRTANIQRVIHIIKRIDQAGVIDIDMIVLDYANAKDVIGVISSLVKRSQDKKADVLGVTFSADERTNSILMTGDPIARQQIRGLIKRLDTPSTKSGNTRVIKLNYVAANDIAPILKGIASTASKANKDQGQKNQEINIEISESSNALIITAPEETLKTMRSVIAELDEHRPQVLVEAVIIEVNDEVLRDIGVQWRTATAINGGAGGFTALSEGLATPAFPALGRGFTLGFFSNNDLRGLLRALESNTSVNILSTPTVVALDSHEAKILVGENVPFITGRSTGASSDTTNPFQTIERQDIGITLTVTPRVNNDKTIVLDIEQNVESISPSVTGTADIVTNKRNINTRVMIKDDEVLVLGGLIRDEIIETENRVPILGKIPLISPLFKSTTRNNIKRNLMVFIHPKILDLDSKKFNESKSRFDHMRNFKDDFNTRLNWGLDSDENNTGLKILEPLHDNQKVQMLQVDGQNIELMPVGNQIAE